MLDPRFLAQNWPILPQLLRAFSTCLLEGVPVMGVQLTWLSEFLVL